MHVTTNVHSEPSPGAGGAVLGARAHAQYPGSLCTIDPWDSPRQGFDGLFPRDML